ncbi:MAG: thioredoxin domain-containing protein [Ferruginibacter sp.]
MDKKFTNHLVTETSPYLLQHAHNPVNWFPWGEEALLKAKEENKVILVSIGYSACHWCHVMERESFENEITADLMNEHFINIKIDREERPDLDHIYMDAVQAISGSGGWPLNVFLTPDAKPFFGGTYFPPVKAFNRSSWSDVLNGISQAWSERKNEIEAQAENLTDHLKKSNSFVQTKIDIASDENIFTTEQCDNMFSAIMKTADKEWGGFGNAPKFPQTFTIKYLLDYYHFSGNNEALQQALCSIDKMLLGGIYDHVGGGLARYSTDREWLAPHFEKMLYDNALLIDTLCDVFQLTGDKKYADAIHKTIGFVNVELLSNENGFFAALDADSEGEEGKYYVWTKQEIDELLGDDSSLFCKFFNVSAEGNWEGKNILRVLSPFEDFIVNEKEDKDKIELIIKAGLRKLLSVREKRIMPALDDKIILGWNALMLKSIAKAAVVLEDKSYELLAEANFNFIEQNLKADSGASLLHTYKDKKAKFHAFLDDYAYYISACLELYAVSFNTKYLISAQQYCDFVVDNFSDEDGVFFYYTHKDQSDVIVRKKEVYDGATPSGNSVMAHNLQILSLIFDNDEWRMRVEKMLTSLLEAVIKYPGSFGIWATLILRKIKGYSEIAVVGNDFAKIARKLQVNYISNIVLMATLEKNNDFPILENKIGEEATLIYLCKNYSCKAPFTNAEELLKEINSIK